MFASLRSASQVPSRGHRVRWEGCHARIGLGNSMYRSFRFYNPFLIMLVARLNVSYPLMFAVENEVNEKVTHCGVLEFSAPEGTVYLPHWVMKSLGVSQGDFVTLRNVTLRLGTFVKLQPQSVAFLDITDPRAVLEHSFRSFSALTVGDMIQISYNDQVYELAIREAKPENTMRAISIVETDLQVDFDPPVGYVEPVVKRPQEKSIAGSLGVAAFSEAGSLSGSPSASLSSSFKPFSGVGNRLKPTASTATAETNPKPTAATQGPTALKLPPGMLFFGQPKSKQPDGKDSQDSDKPPVPGFIAFGGSAKKLR